MERISMKYAAIGMEQPRYIKLNERDNVAIVVNDFGLARLTGSRRRRLSRSPPVANWRAAGRT